LLYFYRFICLFSPLCGGITAYTAKTEKEELV